ncbi:MAG TPA: S41 family peptidase [Nitrospirales bacterium]|jgi:carboxyl-terminal processing protease
MEGKASRIKMGLTIVFVVTLVTGVIIGKGWDRAVMATETYEELKTFTEVLAHIQKHYVEEVKTKDLVYGAIRGMLATLDPHSAFMQPDVYKEVQVETKGEFGGVGIQIGMKENRLTVIAPIDGTPAERAGVKPSDVIMKVNNETTKDMTLMDAVQKMRGPKGTKVTLTIHREGVAEPLVFVLTREIIKIESVKSRMLESNIGYVRLTQFQDQTARDMVGALKKLHDQKMQSLILDLRNNPGGLLTAAIDVSEQFVGLNRLIVYIKTRDGRKDEYPSHIKDQPEDYPMIILVNEGSASASEIVAGALQDWGRAVVVGVQTFGKGSVQTILPLGDGSGLRLTTAKYYTPKGRSIHGIGISPDIVVKGKPTTATPIRERDLDKSLRDPNKEEPAVVPTPLPEPPVIKPESKDGKKDKDAKSKDGKDGKEGEEDDPQLQKATDLLKSWMIFKELRPNQRDVHAEKTM